MAAEKGGLNPSLKILDLGNNAIRRFEDVHVLKELNQLCNINFQGNPICDVDNYKTTLLEMIPTLRILDGQPVEGRHRPILGERVDHASFRANSPENPWSSRVRQARGCCGSRLRRLARSGRSAGADRARERRARRRCSDRNRV